VWTHRNVDGWGGQICKEDTVDFKEPIVKAEPEICSPRIGGEMRKGGQLSSEGPLPLTVRYNCHAPGETVVTVRCGYIYRFLRRFML
jgi:hypothetical protein